MVKTQKRTKLSEKSGAKRTALFFVGKQAILVSRFGWDPFAGPRVSLSNATVAIAVWDWVLASHWAFPRRDRGVARLEDNQLQRAGAGGSGRSFPGAPLLGLERVHSPHDDRRIGHPGQSPARGRCHDFGRRAKGSAVEAPASGHRGRHRGCVHRRRPGPTWRARPGSQPAVVGNMLATSAAVTADLLHHRGRLRRS